MYYRAKSVEEVPKEQIAVWSCTQEGCKGWMRDDFAFDYVPTCPLCRSEMTSSTKMLPMLVNPNVNLKSSKKGVQIR